MKLCWTCCCRLDAVSFLHATLIRTNMWEHVRDLHMSAQFMSSSHVVKYDAAANRFLISFQNDPSEQFLMWHHCGSGSSWCFHTVSPFHRQIIEDRSENLSGSYRFRLLYWKRAIGRCWSTLQAWPPHWEQKDFLKILLFISVKVLMLRDVAYKARRHIDSSCSCLCPNVITPLIPQIFPYF